MTNTVLTNGTETTTGADHRPSESQMFGFDASTIGPQVDPIAPEILADGYAPVDGDEVDRVRARLHEIVRDTGPQLVVEAISHIQTRTRVGGEALARFPGSASPLEWFRTAEALGLRNELELRIISDVIAKAADAVGFIAVNVSPDVLLDPRFLPLIETARGAELVIELTDTESITKTSMLQRQLDAVRALGIRVAVHVSTLDVDTNRLVMLLGPDMVKLNPSLSAALAAGAVDTTAAQNFRMYCRRYGVFVVAVGVQSEEELVALHAAGADAMQGRSLPF